MTNKEKRHEIIQQREAHLGSLKRIWKKRSQLKQENAGANVSGASRGWIGLIRRPATIITVFILAAGIYGLFRSGLINTSPKTASDDKTKESMSTANRGTHDKVTNMPASASERVKMNQGGTTERAPNPQVQALLDEAVRYVDSAQPQKAQELLEQILKIDPTNDKALFELGLVYLIDYKNQTHARELFENALDANPHNNLVINELMNIFYEKDKTDEGATYFKDFLDRHPDSPEVASAIARLYMDSVRDEEAVPYLQKAVDAGYAVEQNLADIARAWSNAGNHDEAVRAYDKAIEAQLKRIDFITKNPQPDPETGNDPEVAIQVSHELLHYLKVDQINQMVQAGQLDIAEKKIQELKRDSPDDEVLNQIIKLIDQKRKSG